VVFHEAVQFLQALLAGAAIPYPLQYGQQALQVNLLPVSSPYSQFHAKQASAEGKQHDKLDEQCKSSST